MLHAIRHRRNADLRWFFALALALVTVLRALAAPAAMASTPEGMVALCSGGQIYYVALDDSGGTETAEYQEPCPAAGLTGPGLAPKAETLAAPAAARAAQLPAALAETSAARRHSHRPRAPPA